VKSIFCSSIISIERFSLTFQVSGFQELLPCLSFTECKLFLTDTLSHCTTRSTAKQGQTLVHSMATYTDSRKPMPENRFENSLVPLSVADGFSFKCRNHIRPLVDCIICHTACKQHTLKMKKLFFSAKRHSGAVMCSYGGSHDLIKDQTFTFNMNISINMNI